jgi:hypothetical protein
LMFIEADATSHIAKATNKMSRQKTSNERTPPLELPLFHVDIAFTCLYMSAIIYER